MLECRCGGGSCCSVRVPLLALPGPVLIPKRAQYEPIGLQSYSRLDALGGMLFDYNYPEITALLVPSIAPSAARPSCAIFRGTDAGP